MRILFVTQNLPYPANSGARLRAKNLIEILTQHHRVKCLFLPFRGSDIQEFHRGRTLDLDYSIAAPRKRTLFGRALEYFSAPLLKQKDVLFALDSLVVDFKPELVWLDYLFLGHYISYFKRRGIPVIYGTHNSQSDLTKQQALAQKSILLRNQLTFLALLHRLHERLFFRKADFVVVVSNQDKIFHENFVDKKKLVTIPNFIDIESYGTSPRFKHEKPYFCFVGSIDNFQNAQGIKFFLREMWHRLRLSPEVFDFFIVGRGAGRDRELQSLIQNRQNIRVFEDVETVIPYLRGAILSIVPLLQGSGTRLKIIESMACETPVVSTSVGAEGLGATNGKEILIADTADSFADAIMRLLNDKALCQQIADNAYQFATANFGFESAERNVQYMTNEICGGTW